MMYHIIATLPGGRRKSIPNKTEEQVLTEYVIPYVSTGVIKAKWGKKTNSYQVVHLRIYQTEQPWDKRVGVKLEDFIGDKKRNQFNKFEKKAKSALGIGTWRCFVVMPIQGEKYGTQEDQRVFQEYDKRFEAIESLLSDFETAAIRIDKEHPLEDIVGKIKKEIRSAHFIIADLTDERPSCYFEAGYAEALPKPIIYISSKNSVIETKRQTKIHFDIHMNVNFFSNHEEMSEKLRNVIEKNRNRLFAVPEEPTTLKA
jgi:hypothetical protein